MSTETLFAVTLLAMALLAYISHKKKWKITEFF